MGGQLKDSNWPMTQLISHLGGSLLFGALEKELYWGYQTSQHRMGSLITSYQQSTILLQCLSPRAANVF